MRTLIKNGTIVTSENQFKGDILIEGEKIKCVSASADAEADRVIDAEGKYVLPGGIDQHVHFSFVYKGSKVRGFETSNAAALGGTTTVIEFVNQVKDKGLIESLEEYKASDAEGIAMVEGVGADGLYACADGERGQLLAADEGIVADAGDIVADGDALQVLPFPWGIGAPEVVNGGVAVVVHVSAAADGQRGVLAILLGEAPCGIGAALAADVAVGHLETIEISICGEGDRVCRARLRVAGNGQVRIALLELHVGNGDVVGSSKSKRSACHGQALVLINSYGNIGINGHIVCKLVTNTSSPVAKAGVNTPIGGFASTADNDRFATTRHRVNDRSLCL